MITDPAFLTVTILLAVALDLAIGDPPWPWHPVRLVGKWIALMERVLRRAGLSGPAGGGILVVVTMAGCAGPALWLYASIKTRFLSVITGSVILYFSIALGSLLRAGRTVQRALAASRLDEARAGVAALCGREVERLDEDQVTRATIESLAENSVDAFTAPIFYAALFGPIGAWVYRIANTLDSIVGYKNETYLHFGRAAARLDDALNYIPARLTAFLLSCGAPLARGSIRNAIWCVRQFAHLHPSPNAGWTESAAAGALDLRLGGPAFYFGKEVDKPYLGTGSRRSDPQDIGRARRLVLFGGLSFAALTCAALAVLIP